MDLLDFALGALCGAAIVSIFWAAAVMDLRAKRDWRQL
jgi:hypothetical protein